MSKKLTWDETGEKLFETGIDRGVVYPYDPSKKDYGAGVAWNGLTSVSDSPEGAEATKLYADNGEYVELRSAETLGMTIEAYMYPDEFAILDGTKAIAKGVYVGQQTRGMFGFCYRTLVGNDVEDTDYGYKLHIVYGCKASPSEKQYSTTNDSPEAITFSWTCTTSSIEIGEGFKKAAEIVIDTTKLDSGKNNANLKALETMLYGSDEKDAALPLPSKIIELFGTSVSNEAAG